MAAKGAAFGIRHLLKKVDENFAWAKPRGRQRRRKGQPNGRECQRGLPRLKKVGENFTCEAPQANAPPQAKPAERGWQSHEKSPAYAGFG